jgi:PAS domain S-box-containing protein/putative nucleotidyltransferase with HDIG domain
MKSKLAIVVTLSGWFLLVAFLFYVKVEHGDQTVRYIFHPQSSHELLFHVVVFLAPLISSIMGFLVNERTKFFETIKESEEKYHDFYENAPDGYHSLGPDGTILDVNDTWLRMLGYESDEVIGKMKLSDLLTDEGLKIYQNTFNELKRKGFIENIEYALKRKDGTLLPVLINATAFYDKKGNFLKTRSVFRDISVRKSYEKKLEHAAEEWKITFDSMPYGIILLDKEHNIIRVNNYISALTGLSYKEIIGEKCYKVIFGKDESTERCPLPATSNIRGSETFEFHIPRFNKDFIGYVKPVAGKENLVDTFVLSLVDITEIKDKEKKLTKSRDAFINMLKDLDISFKELEKLYNSLIRAFVNAIDAKSPWTKGHSERVTDYAISIAKEMALKEKEIETLRIAALLHDIGKIGTYDVILDKPGKLTDEEFALIKMHPVRGEEILRPIGQLQSLLPIIRHHHERIDGKGYPDKLKGKEIPLLARIICVADSFDSMTSDRPYRPAPPKEYAISEINKCSGTQFDIQAAEAFLKVLSKSQG